MKKAEVDKIVHEVCSKFPTFGGGKHSQFNPLVNYLSERQPVFALGVDVEKVVREVLRQAKKIGE